MCIKWLDKHSGSMIAILTFFLVCVTGIYVFLTHKMLEESRRQTEITNRPYVGIGQFDVSMEPNTISFALDLINIGKTPATEVMIEYDWIPVYKGWELVQEVEGKTVKIEKNKVQNLFMGQPTTIFPSQILGKRFTIGYNHTLEYWIEKYKEIAIIVTIYYRGIEPRGFQDFYKSWVKLKYKPDKKNWIIEESEVY